MKKNHKYFDDKLALAELLERRHLCQSRTVAERRTVLRISRAQSSLFVDTHRAANVPELPVARQAGATSTLIDTDIENLYESDELDDFSADDGALYDEELLEDL
ncbi:hypothetical protein H7J08_21670 [Mycobacterium frederiksbergense]|nr:hypothetical protein [Mycolicibacterium frederiksbergense]